MSRKLWKNRILSTAVSLVMVLSAMPATSFAAGAKEADEAHTVESEIVSEAVLSASNDTAEEYIDDSWTEVISEPVYMELYETDGEVVPSETVLKENEWAYVSWDDEETAPYQYRYFSFTIPYYKNGTYDLQARNSTGEAIELQYGISKTEQKGEIFIDSDNVNHRLYDLEYTVSAYEIWAGRYIKALDEAAIQIRIVRTDNFADYKEDAKDLVIDGSDNHITVTNRAMFWRDTLDKIKIGEEESGVYRFEADSIADAVKLYFFNDEGEYQGSLVLEKGVRIAQELTAGTWYVALEWDDLSGASGDAVSVDVSLAIKKAPTLSELDAVIEDDATLYWGVDGVWENTGTEEAPVYSGEFKFEESAVRDLFDFYAIYNDGTREAVSNWDVQIQSAFYDYKEGFLRLNPGEKGTGERQEYSISFSFSGKTTNAVVPVSPYASQPKYADAEALTLDGAMSMSGDSIVMFTPERDGKYYFYTNGVVDTYGELFYEMPEAWNDDVSLDGLNYLISVNLKKGKTYLLKTTVPSGETESYEVIVSKTAPESLASAGLTGRNINLAFVVDTTGSMWDEIQSVKNNLQNFVDIIAATGANLRIALIDYQDITKYNGEDDTVIHYNKKTGGKSVWYEKKASSDSDDMAALKAEIGTLTANNGGDIPECAVDALGNLVFDDIMMFNSDAARFAFLVTDADYKDDNIHGITDMAELTGMLKAKGIAVTVITNTYYYDVYRSLTSETGGSLLNIRDDFLKGMRAFALDIVKATKEAGTVTTVTPVTEISINGITGGTVEVPVGKTRQFKTVIKPDNATYKDVIWSVESSDGTDTVSPAEIVKQDGRSITLRGINENTSENWRVYATSRDGGYTTSFALKVQKVVFGGTKVETCNIEELKNEIKGKGSHSSATSYTLYEDAADEAADSSVISEEDQKEIFKELPSGEEVTFEFDDVNGDKAYSWTFTGGTGDSALDPEKTIKSFRIDKDKGSAADDKAIADGMTATLPVKFSHEGELPGKAEIEIPVKELPDIPKDGEGYKLYYYNEEEGKLEEADDTTVTINSDVATFKITHCSTYVIGTKDKDVSMDYGVYFESNGGTMVEPQRVKQGEAATKPADPTREGYTFAGWYKDADCTQAWDFSSDMVKGLTILHAKWTGGSVTTATGVTLNYSEIGMFTGDVDKLVATVGPDSAKDKSVTWTSSDQAILSVTDAGVITALKEGSATITATSKANSSAVASCAVTIEESPTDVLVVKEKAVLSATVPADSWSVSGSNVKVKKKGKKTAVVTGLSAGTAHVKASYKGSEVAEFVVRVEKTELAARTFDKKAVLNVADLIEGNKKAVPTSFKSSKNSVIRVNSRTGEMTVLKSGKTKITAYYGKTAVSRTYEVKLPSIAAKLSVKSGSSKNLVIKNFNAGVGDYTVQTHTEGVVDVTLSASGTITVKGVSAGTTTLTLCVDGVEYGRCRVKVS